MLRNSAYNVLKSGLAKTCFLVVLLLSATVMSAGIGDYIPKSADDLKGTAEIKATLQQTPKVGALNSAYAGDTCQVKIPFQGTIRIPAWGGEAHYWFVHSDGTKSSELSLPASGAPVAISYEWIAKAPANKPYSGWAMIEVESSINSQKGESSKAYFTVTCIPQKAPHWASPPLKRQAKPQQDCRISGVLESENYVATPFWMSTNVIVS